jgi:hypothetical protein
MKRAYVDTSAYLCRLLGEAGADEVAVALEGAQLHTSSLLVLEARRSLVWMARRGHLTSNRLHSLLEALREDLAAFAVKDLTVDLCADATMPAVTTPRSLDLAHLRTALWFHRRQPLDCFVTRDEAQRQAAKELGLPAP